MATKIKVDGKWYRGGEKADGLIEFKDDLNYNGSTTQVEYIAKKPNPVLHPGLYHVFNMSGSKEGEFWTDPQISYSGCVTDIETDIRNSSGSTINPPKNSFPKREESSGCLGWAFAIVLYMAFKNWGGRIGLILGVILCIIGVTSGMPAGNIIFFLPMTIFFGFIIGVLVNFIKKLVTKNK